MLNLFRPRRSTTLGCLLCLIGSATATRGDQRVITFADPTIESGGDHIGVGGRLVETDENFVENEIWVEAWWAQLDNPNSSKDAEFISGHFHVASSPDWHIIQHGHSPSFEGEYQGFFIEALDGRPFTLISIDYRLLTTDSGAPPFDTELLVATQLDPLLPIEDQSTAFVISSATDFSTLQFSQFSDVTRIYISVTLGPVQERLLWDNVVIDLSGCTAAVPGSCDDGDACTTDSCVDDECSYSAVACNDGNACTDDFCDIFLGCQTTNNSNSCADSLFCNGPESCADGSCQAGADPCPAQFCDETAGTCVDCLSDANCDDQNPCTDGSCEGGICAFVPNSDSCDDGTACTSNDTCLNGVCSGAPIDCDDGNSCTDHTCDAAIGCVTTVRQGACDDGLPCTQDDVCQNGQCIGDIVVDCACTIVGDCADGNPCTSETCADLVCVSSLSAGPCDDGNPCTTNDACNNGTCDGTGTLDCDDLNPCTDDSCDLAVGCQHSNNSNPCDNGNPCTENDTCASAVCTAGSAVACDDANECTDDSCDPLSGCVHTDNSDACDDTSFCNGPESCSAGACQPGALPCAEQVCDESSDACVECLVVGDCDDGLFCNGPESCGGANTCVAGVAPCEPSECDESSDTCTIPTGPGCQDIRRLTVRCDDTGGIEIIAVLHDSAFDGESITASVDDDVFDIVISGRVGFRKYCCPPGVVTVTLETPAGCFDPVSLDCAAGIPVGACCMVDETCTVSTAADCTGTYQGDGTSCVAGLCAMSTGGCCLTDLTCSVVLDVDCAASGGVFLGDGSDCSLPCVAPTGACCASDVCTIDTSTACAGNGGTYLGNSTTCDGDPCQPPGEIPCAAVRRLRARCINGSSGEVKVLVTFVSNDYAGQIASATVDGVVVNMPIINNAATVTTCCHSGLFDVILLTPAGCVDPVSLTCP